MCCWTHRTARILVTRAHYPVGPVSYSLLYTALMAMEDTKTCSSRAIEDQHGQLAETPPAIEVNRGEPAETSHQPVLAVFVAPFFCLSLFSWFPLLLRRIQHNNNSQGFLYNHSWQATPCSGHFRFSQPVLCKNVAAFLAKNYIKTSNAAEGS